MSAQFLASKMLLGARNSVLNRASAGCSQLFRLLFSLQSFASPTEDVDANGARGEGDGSTSRTDGANTTSGSSTSSTTRTTNMSSSTTCSNGVFSTVVAAERLCVAVERLLSTPTAAQFGGAFEYPVFYTCVASGLIYWQRAIMSIIMVKGVAQDFELSLVEQGEVLSSFFLGYIIGGFTASRVLQRNPMPLYLPNFILKCAIASSAISTLFIALVAASKVQLFLARLLTGIGQGFFFPSCYVLLAQVVESPSRKTTALGRMGAATQGAVALTYFVSAEIPEWHHATAIAALSALPLLYAMICTREYIALPGGRNHGGSRSRGGGVNTSEAADHVEDGGKMTIIGRAMMSPQHSRIPVGGTKHGSGTDEFSNITNNGNGISNSITSSSSSSNSSTANKNSNHVPDPLEPTTGGDQESTTASSIPSATDEPTSELQSQHSSSSWSSSSSSSSSTEQRLCSSSSPGDVNGRRNRGNHQKNGTAATGLTGGSGPSSPSRTRKRDPGGASRGSKRNKNYNRGTSSMFSRMRDGIQSNFGFDWWRYHPVDDQPDWIAFAGDYVVPGTVSPYSSPVRTHGAGVVDVLDQHRTSSVKKIYGVGGTLGQEQEMQAIKMVKNSSTGTSPMGQVQREGHNSSASCSSPVTRVLSYTKTSDDHGSTEEELECITGEDGVTRPPRGNSNLTAEQQKELLYMLITSRPFCAIMTCHFCHNWCNFILLAWLPTFFGKKNVVMSAFPYLLCAIAAPVFPYYCERELAKKRDLWHVRRELAVVALLFPGILFVAMPFVHDPRLQSVMFSAVLVCGAAVHSSVLAGPLDLAGESYVGTLLATTNMVAALPGIVGVQAAAYCKESLGWNGVFVSCAVLYFVAISVYLSFGSVKRLV
ncbi:unnamed protein product [Amoebophrya sp. A25]|nr:unnamed protein product [Amoebophrya sp. A25]|eukprot:GSA25T00018234001.1